MHTLTVAGKPLLKVAPSDYEVTVLVAGREAARAAEVDYIHPKSAQLTAELSSK